MESSKTIYDFTGWATKNDIKCADGRTIRQDAFKSCDGQVVPIVWMHKHNSPDNILGHALLENKPGGVRTFGKFNNTPEGKKAKELVDCGDISSLSIWANDIHESSAGDVLHGIIREVSLVIGGANPGAKIDGLTIAHSINGDDDYDETSAVISTGEPLEKFEAPEETDNTISHADESKEDNKADDESVADVLETLNDKQRVAVIALLDAVVNGEDEEDDEDEVKHSIEGGNTMNVFENNGAVETKRPGYLSHDAMTAIIADGKKYGTLKESFLAHADEEETTTTSDENTENTQTYGISNIDYLFPDAKNINNVPEFIKRDTGWVSTVMNGVHNTPFSRIKSIFADITEDDARAKGYFKGNLKKDEVFTLLKRTTTPQTIYKKQKLDRDDIIDITDFDVVAWIKTEMRMMLEEEIARAILVGDGRLSSSDDKISETNVRPIWTDADLYTIKATVSVPTTADSGAIASETIDTILRSRKNYKGSGNPTFFCSEDVLTEMLLLKDSTGRRLYNTENDVATALRVSKIVTVPVLENLSRTVNGTTYALSGIIVNLNDYNVGADKGGSINLFDDFDIDYNQQKYLIETRVSGALIKPHSAIAVEVVRTSSSS